MHFHFLISGEMTGESAKVFSTFLAPKRFSFLAFALSFTAMQELFELVEKHRWAVASADEEAALESIINRISPDIYLFILGRVPESAAQDVRSNALVEITKSWPAFTGSRSSEAWAWCYTIAARQVAQFWAAEAKKPTIVMDPSVLTELIDAGLGEETRSDDVDGLRRTFQEALKILEKSDPECFLLLWDRFIVGMTFPEIGTERGKEPSTVRMKTNKCLEKIEPLLT